MFRSIQLDGRRPRSLSGASGLLKGCGVSLLALAAVAAMAGIAGATEVGGSVTTNTTWNVAGSPYTLVSVLTIHNAATLTIEPGVEVDVNSYAIQVGYSSSSYGNLSANGATFTGSGFRAIHVAYGTAAITGCTFAGFDYPCLFNESSLEFSGNDLSGCTYEAIEVSSSIDYNNVTWRGDWDVPIRLTGVVTIRYNKLLTIEPGVEVDVNSYAIQVGYSSSSYGNLSANGATFTGSGFRAIYATYGTASITRCVLRNLGTAIVTSGETTMSLIDNCFGGNVTAVSNSSVNQVIAENNWWGDSRGPTHPGNPHGAGDLIVGDVDYEPWLTESVCSSTGSVEGIIYADVDFSGTFTPSVDSLLVGAVVSTQLGDTTITNVLGEYRLNDTPAAWGYELTAGASGFFSKTTTDVVVTADSTTHVDFGLEWVGFASARIDTLIPNPNPLVSLVEQGGTVHRHYAVYDSATGVPLAGVTVRVESGPLYYSCMTDSRGEAHITVPSDDIGDGLPGSSASYEIVAVNEQLLPANDRIAFTCQIADREYAKFWEHDSYGRLGISFLQIEAGGGARTILKETEDSQPGVDRLAIERQGRAGGGLAYKVQAPLQVAIGDIGFAAQAGIEGLVSFVTEDAYEFPHPIPNDVTAEAEYILLTSSKISILDNMLIRLLSFLEDSFGGTLSDAYMFDSKGVDLRGSANASMLLGVSTGRRCLVGANLEGGAEGHVNLLDQWLPAVSSERLAFGSSKAVEGTASLGMFLDQPRGLESNKILTKLGLNRSWSGTWGGEIAARFDSTTKELLAAELISLKRVEDWDSASETKTEITIRGDHAIDIFRALPNAAATAVLNPWGTLVSLVAGPGAFGPLFTEAFSELSDLQDPSKTALEIVNDTDVEYVISKADVTKVGGFDLSISLSATGEQTISGTVAAGTGFSEGYEAIVERGKWVRGQFYPSETYDNIPKDISTTYQELWQQIDENIPFSIKALAFLSDVFSFFGSSQSDAQLASFTGPDTFWVADCGSFMVFPTGSVPDTVESVYSHSWGWWGGSPCASESMLSTNQKIRHRAIKAEAEESFGMSYGVGGFYQFEPHGLALQLPATFVMTYQDEDVVNINESELAMYRELKDTHEFKFIGGIVDTVANTVTAQIDTLGLFTLAPRLPSGTIELIPLPDVLPADSASVSTITSDTLRNNDGSLVDDGTLYTVSSNAGFIITADADTAEGIQIPCTDGRITFDLMAGPIAFDAEVTAKSVYGTAEGSTVIEFTDGEAPGAPSGFAVDFNYGVGQVVASWNRNKEADIAGYKIYFDDDASTPPYTGKVSAEGIPSPIDVMADTSVIITGLHPDSLYYFTVTCYDVAGNEGAYAEVQTLDLTGVKPGGRTPEELLLRNNYPNPFGRITTIEYSLPRPSHVRLYIFDAMGRLVKTLVDQPQGPGEQRVTWDGTGNSGRRVAAGVYFYVLRTEEKTQSKKMILLR